VNKILATGQILVQKIFENIDIANKNDIGLSQEAIINIQNFCQFHSLASWWYKLIYVQRK